MRPAADGGSGGPDGRDRTDVEALLDATRGGARVTALLRRVVDRFGPREFGLEDTLPGRRRGPAAHHRRCPGRPVRRRLRPAAHRPPRHARRPGHGRAPRCRPSCAARSRWRSTAGCGPRWVPPRRSTDPAAYRPVRSLVREAREEGVALRRRRPPRRLADAVSRAVDDAAATPDDATVERAVGMVAPRARSWRSTSASTPRRNGCTPRCVTRAPTTTPGPAWPRWPGGWGCRRARCRSRGDRLLLGLSSGRQVGFSSGPGGGAADCWSLRPAGSLIVRGHHRRADLLPAPRPACRRDLPAL